MKRRKETLGRLELEVLQHVADQHPIGVREVAEHFAKASGHARTTVLTVMERLRAKGYLTRRKIDGRHQYAPTVMKSELLRGMVADFVTDVLGGDVSPFVAYLSRSSKLSSEEIRKLEQLLRSIEAREQRGGP